MLLNPSLLRVSSTACRQFHDLYTRTAQGTPQSIFALSTTITLLALRAHGSHDPLNRDLSAMTRTECDSPWTTIRPEWIIFQASYSRKSKGNRLKEGMSLPYPIPATVLLPAKCSGPTCQRLLTEKVAGEIYCSKAIMKQNTTAMRERLIHDSGLPLCGRSSPPFRTNSSSLLSSRRGVLLSPLWRMLTVDTERELLLELLGSNREVWLTNPRPRHSFLAGKIN